MSTDDKNFDRIEAYLFGQMPPAEARVFEHALAADAALAAEVARQRLEHRAMELLHQADLKANLAVWKVEKEAMQQSSRAKTVPIGSTRRLIFRIAAAASVLLVIGFFAQRYLGGADASQLAANYFEQNATSVRVRGGGDVPEALRPALEQMEHLDYRTALATLQGVQETTLRGKADLLEGECHFRMGDYAAAVTTFQKVTQTGAPAEKEEAQYFLLLTWLTEGKHKAEAEALMRQILAEPEHGYYGRVKELEGKL